MGIITPPVNFQALVAAAALPIPTQAPNVSIGGVGIQDSTGATTAAVKAASTAPAATDPALVVSLSPNSYFGSGLTAQYNSTQPSYSSGQNVTLQASNRGALIVETSINALRVGAKYNSTQPVYSDGQSTDLQTSNRGALIVETSINPLDINAKASSSGGATYTHVAAGTATTTIKSGAGKLYAIVINSKATASNVTTVYDSTTATGTVIAIPDAANINAGTTISFGPAGLAFANGLTIATTAANGSDMTILWK